jgi:hypothetical protein
MSYKLSVVIDTLLYGMQPQPKLQKIVQITVTCSIGLLADGAVDNGSLYLSTKIVI